MPAVLSPCCPVLALKRRRIVAGLTASAAGLAAVAPVVALAGAAKPDVACSALDDGGLVCLANSEGRVGKEVVSGRLLGVCSKSLPELGIKVCRPETNSRRKVKGWL